MFVKAHRSVLLLAWLSCVGLSVGALIPKGAVLVQSGDVAGIRTVAVDALYRHMGFTRFGTIYKYARHDV